MKTVNAILEGLQSGRINESSLPREVLNAIDDEVKRCVTRSWGVDLEHDNFKPIKSIKNDMLPGCIITGDGKAIWGKIYDGKAEFSQSLDVYGGTRSIKKSELNKIIKNSGAYFCGEVRNSFNDDDSGMKIKDRISKSIPLRNEELGTIKEVVADRLGRFKYMKSAVPSITGDGLLQILATTECGIKAKLLLNIPRANYSRKDFESSEVSCSNKVSLAELERDTDELTHFVSMLRYDVRNALGLIGRYV